jgi:N-alpha-acetyl-L-2,4-diaminobutyrate deacetylase
MSRTKTRVATDLDPDADGKQVTRLFVPNPRDDSAWGAVAVPVASIRNGEGPRVLLTGGAHGDEYEGPLALWELVRRLEPAAIRGQVLAIPVLNVPGMRAGRRLSPVDGRDLNRSFPGEADGTPTVALAHYVSSELLPRVEAVVDFHSGGRSLRFQPCGVMHHLPDPDRAARTLAALKAFGAPWALVLEELDATGMLDTLVEELGKTFLTTELGGGGRIDPAAAGVARRGVWNLLEHFGVLTGERPSEVPPGADDPRYVEVPDRSYYTLAPVAGVYEPAFDLGDAVRAGQVVGRVHFPEEPAREPVALRAARDGILFAERVPARTDVGDTLAVLARDR